MTTTVLNIIPAKYVEATPTPQYTVSAPEANTVRTIIDAFVVTNTGTAAALFSCYLVINNGSEGNDNLFINEQRIEPGESYLCPEVIGQALEDGGFIVTNTNVVGTLTMRATGRLITT